MKKNRQFISGLCQQLLFSPKGGVEGVLVNEQERMVQVAVSADIGAVFASSTGPGARVCVLAVPDRRAKAKHVSHPVYLFESFADETGQAIEPSSHHRRKTTIKGVVAALHFARHGQANGVMLETGEFIHLRPGGMSDSRLEVGSKVNAVGHVRVTQLGNRLLEAHKVNRVDLR